MSWQGWTFMLSAWTLVTGLFVWSFYKVLRSDKTSKDSGENPENLR